MTSNPFGSKKRSEYYRDREESDIEYAMRNVSDWVNPVRGYANLIREQDLQSLIQLSAFPVGYWTVGQMIGGTAAEGFGMGSHVSIILGETPFWQPVAAVAGGYLLGAAVGTAILTPFGKASEALTFYSSLYSVALGIRDIPKHAEYIFMHYLHEFAGEHA